MVSSLWRFGTTLALLGLLCTAAATVGAQPPPSFLTQWGTEGSGDGEFMSPLGVATDAEGNVYVADNGNRRIQKFTSAGVFLTKWGSQGSGNGQFGGGMFGVATDAAGNVYVTDGGNSRIQKFTGAGAYITQWGSQGDGNGQFAGIFFLAADAAGNVYVSEQNNRIQKFSSDGTYLTQWPCVDSLGNTFNANGIAVDATGNVYVTDTTNDRIWKYSGSGVYLTKWGSFGTGDGQFDIPFGLATDVTGDVYVGDAGGSRIQKFTNTGTYLTQWGTFGTGPGQFYTARGVATGPAGVIYVADDWNRIQKFGPSVVDVPLPDDDRAKLRLAIWPNPSRAVAQMTFALPAASRALVEIFDIQGRRVALALDSELAAGDHSATWDGHVQNGRTAAAGLYFAQMSAGGQSVMQRFVLLR